MVYLFLHDILKRSHAQRSRLFMQAPDSAKIRSDGCMSSTAYWFAAAGTRVCQGRLMQVLLCFRLHANEQKTFPLHVNHQSVSSLGKVASCIFRQRWDSDTASHSNDQQKDSSKSGVRLHHPGQHGCWRPLAAISHNELLAILQRWNPIECVSTVAFPGGG
jgi:hypothetical protein